MHHRNKTQWTYMHSFRDTQSDYVMLTVETLMYVTMRLLTVKNIVLKSTYIFSTSS